MTYYEVATVKKYKRKNNKDSTQINLGVNSKFKKNTKVVVISEDNFKKIIGNKNVDLKKELDDLKAKFEESKDLKDKLLKEKEEKEKLLITITTHERNINDKDILITEKDNTIDNYKKDIETKDNLIETKDNTIAEYEKDIEDKDDIIETLTHKWVWYKRIFNRLPSEVNLNKDKDG